MKQNKYNFFYFTIVFALTVFLPVSLVNARTESTNYVIFGDVFSSGGLASSTSNTYGLADTIGEAMILSATSTSDNYGIKAGFQELYVDQYLTFSLGSSSLALGTLDSAAATTGSHTMLVDTNAFLGFSVTVAGATLTSGGNTINAIGATATASSVGSEQFGINLVANTSPSVGAAPSGTAPIGIAAGQYGVANSFAYNSGDTVASATVATNATTYTLSYLANISSATESGSYATTLTYSATANF